MTQAIITLVQVTALTLPFVLSLYLFQRQRQLPREDWVMLLGLGAALVTIGWKVAPDTTNTIYVNLWIVSAIHLMIVGTLVLTYVIRGKYQPLSYKRDYTTAAALVVLHTLVNDISPTYGDYITTAFPIILVVYVLGECINKYIKDRRNER